MKIDKHNKDVRLVKIEELSGKKLIPTSLVLFHSDYENCKEPDEEKLKIFGKVAKALVKNPGFNPNAKDENGEWIN